MAGGNEHSRIIKMLERHLPGRISGSIKLETLGGGSINQTRKLILAGEQFVLKMNDKRGLPGLFMAEARGLAALAAADCIRTPELIFCDEDEEQQYLLLEWIEPGRPSKLFWQRFGEQLAALHQVNQDSFGFEEDNYMGALPQQNAWSGNWIDFFEKQRLQPQLELALKAGLADAALEQKMVTLYSRFPAIFPEEKPALLHGDLWSGNFLCDQNEQPVLIDPAVYYGHRSVDMGMTTLFGGFDSSFYESYQSAFPQTGSYRSQWSIANLYPLFIHLNLFGSSYLPAIRRTLEEHL